MLSGILYENREKASGTANGVGKRGAPFAHVKLVFTFYFHDLKSGVLVYMVE